MRRILGLLGGVAILMFGMLAAGSVFLSGAGAQEGSPPAGGPPPGGFEIAPGVTAEAIAFAEGREDPSVYRLTFDAGVTYNIQQSPALEVAYVESGSLTITLSAAITIGQLGATDTSGEAVAAGTEVTVQAGQYFVLPPMTTGEVRNDGAEAASVSIANILPAPAATPEATPAS
jgi:quercetin dioxygenase-like cupin family protein